MVPQVVIPPITILGNFLFQFFEQTFDLLKLTSGALCQVTDLLDSSRSVDLLYMTDYFLKVPFPCTRES